MRRVGSVQESNIEKYSTQLACRPLLKIYAGLLHVDDLATGVAVEQIIWSLRKNDVSSATYIMT
jgi:hypothetical protein